MNTSVTQEIIESAIRAVSENSRLSTDGSWLERITVTAGPHIKDWDIERCYGWSDWPERVSCFPGTTNKDVGIDVVGIRRSDGAHIAIQCKSRKLNEHGRGNPISKQETDKFANASSNPFWAERWIVTNGDNALSGNARQVSSMSDTPIKMVNIATDLQQQQEGGATDEACPHCQPNPDDESRIQTRSCMQRDAVNNSIRILREHELSDSGGLPRGQARGKIILPCGTGKTRISLRIIEKLTPPGKLSVVLCPSIALVAQIRREYLQNAEGPMRLLAVCSDKTAGYDPKKEGVRNTAADPTVDNSNVSALEVKGKVTTDASEIAEWIQQGESSDNLNIIVGTYQSSYSVAVALRLAGAEVKVLVADEAHRTAGLRRQRKPDAEQRIRDFTLCHHNDELPATYRVYQTATPRIYNTKRRVRKASDDWIVRSMDDEAVFGVELYRKSYVEAVHNKWLSDYRIIALAINDHDAHEEANRLAKNTGSKGRSPLTTTKYLNGLAFALAMGGATQNKANGEVVIKSCIAFMNTVDKSKNMAADLNTEAVREWVDRWLDENRAERRAAKYTLEHLDATSNVTTRENGKLRLAEGTAARPHGIINVGIFGEGTDSPSLNAVAFLEPRKSPIDVIQAVGRAMRTAPGKEFGYIICPILIPPSADPEQWLSTSDMDEGWQELGEILLALRAHDHRIEDELEGLLYLYIPKPPETQHTIIAVAHSEGQRIQYRQHHGAPGEAQIAVERVLKSETTLADEFVRITENQPGTLRFDEPTQIVTGKSNKDGSTELRMGTVAREKPSPDGTPGKVNIPRTKKKAKKMINEGEGIRVKSTRKRKTREERAEESALKMLRLSGLSDSGSLIKLNLLSKSGLTDNRILRDLNILESSINEAAFHLRSDELKPTLNKHFGLDNLKKAALDSQADGCTIATLLMMNAAMLHQRISSGRWLSGITDLSTIKSHANVVQRIAREWERIMRHDFVPVLAPALDTIYGIETTGKTAGLERALRHIAAEAERIAETYADMGADHAGPLFNRVMGNQASDGAFFTRPAAASIAARLTLDVCGDKDWNSPEIWRDHKTVDLACGSGTLLAAMLTELKRRASAQGASKQDLALLQKVAVEETLKGLDINPVSLQLAASQLTTGNQEIRYRRMGLYLMPYGPQSDQDGRVSVGTLELLGQSAIIPRKDELGLDDDIASQLTWTPSDDTELEDATTAVKDARIVIMNPPYSSRKKMGEKFPAEIKAGLRSRVDAMENVLVSADPNLLGFADKNSIRPLFVALADRIIRSDGVIAMISPTIALSTTSGLEERQILAQRFHIHTVLTCHQPGNVNMSQNTGIHESIVVMCRHTEVPKPPTRFVHLDKMPIDEREVEDLHICLQECVQGPMSDGWGEVSHWLPERMEAGDWSPATWRSPELAEAARQFAKHHDMRSIREHGFSCHATRELMRKQYFTEATVGTLGTFPILSSKGADGQQTIRSAPDAVWQPANLDEEIRVLNGGTYPQVDKLLSKSGYLLITSGQNTSTARLTAVANEERFVGRGWLPVTGPTAAEANAIAVFLNSTAGRLQLLRNAGRTLVFPQYNPEPLEGIRIPNIRDPRIQRILADCWEKTKDIEVPQFRDGECAVRAIWDNAVADAMGWDPAELARLRELLHLEPHVRGLGYNQYADEIEDSLTS